MIFKFRLLLCYSFSLCACFVLLSDLSHRPYWLATEMAIIVHSFSSKRTMRQTW